MFTVAAGNDNLSACMSSPSDVRQAIVTGAIASDDSMAWFSNNGACVSIFGPGVDITSAARFGGSTQMSGPSMASPHAAGVAALCLERHPGNAAAVKACVLDAATAGRLSGVLDSPNLLLFAREP